MKNKVAGWTAAVLLLASVGSLLAHHSLALMDTTTAVKVKGVVVRFEHVNPHSILFLDQKGALRWNKVPNFASVRSAKSSMKTRCKIFAPHERSECKPDRAQRSNNGWFGACHGRQIAVKLAQLELEGTNMKGRFLLIAVVAALMTQRAAAQVSTITGATVPPIVRDTIKSAGTALGMEFRLNADNITSAEFWGSGSAGQAKVTDYHVSIDYSAPMSMRVDYMKNNQRNIEVISIDGNTRTKFSWNETEPGGGTVTPALQDAEERWLHFWTMTPHAVLKAAVDTGELAKVSKASGATVITFPFANASCRDGKVFGTTAPCTNVTGANQNMARINFTVTLDAKNLVQKVETRANNVVTETTFSDYKDLSESKSGKVFPGRIVQKRGSATLWDITVNKVDPDYPTVYIVTPESVRTAAAQQATGRD